MSDVELIKKRKSLFHTKKNWERIGATSGFCLMESDFIYETQCSVGRINKARSFHRLHLHQIGEFIKANVAHPNS